MTSYGILLGGATTACVVIGSKTGDNGEFNAKTSTTAGLVSTGVSSTAYGIMEAKLQNTIDKYSVETTTAYVQQLSDEELEAALMQFDLLEKDDQNDVKVL